MPILFIQVVWTQCAIFPRYACMSDLFELINESPVWPYQFILFYWLYLAAHWILVPCPGMEPEPPAGQTRSPHHWTTKEFPLLILQRVRHFLSWRTAHISVLADCVFSWNMNLSLMSPTSWYSTFRQGCVPGSVLYWCLVVLHQEG